MIRRKLSPMLVTPQRTLTHLTMPPRTANPIDGTPVFPPSLTHTDLSTSVSSFFNIPYLSRAPMQLIRPHKIEGILHGSRSMLKPIVSMVAAHGLNAVHVHFLVEPNSPKTFISREAITALLGREYLTPSEFPMLRLSGYTARAEQSRYWFSGLNLLGVDFLREHGARVDVNYMRRSVEVSFRSTVGARRI